MITTTNSEKILTQVGKVFGHPTVKGHKVNDAYTTMAFNVQRISKPQLLALATMVDETDCDIELKRSGTGITVNLK